MKTINLCFLKNSVKANYTRLCSKTPISFISQIFTKESSILYKKRGELDWNGVPIKINKEKNEITEM